VTFHVVTPAAVWHVLVRKPFFGGFEVPFEQPLDVRSDGLEDFLLVHRAQPTDQ
jgi:hypothetical protein